MRGSSTTLRRSLRTRVTAASIAAGLALAVVVCVLLPHGYRVQGRERLRAEAAGIAEAVVLRLQATEGAYALPPDTELAAWATAHPSLDRVALLDADGAEIDGWPHDGDAWDRTPLPSHHTEEPPFLVASHPVGSTGADADGAAGWRVGVRMSSALHLVEVSEVRWLFAAIFLLIGGILTVLTRYFALSILIPLEDIAGAARSLADGEPMVQWPETGDGEIDALGEVISRLGQGRRRPRAKEVPPEVMEKLGTIDPQPDAPGDAPQPRVVTEAPDAPTEARSDAAPQPASPMGKE